jgi:hypothetical protein
MRHSVDNSGRAFPFLRVNRRPPKPRTRGITEMFEAAEPESRTTGRR